VRDEGEGRVRQVRRGIAEVDGVREQLSRRVVNSDVPRVLADAHLAEGARIRHGAVAILDAPRAIRRHRSGEHERPLALHHRSGEVTRAESKAQRARTDEGDLERQRRIPIVLRAGKLRGLRARVDDVRLLERHPRSQRVAVPLERAASSGRIEAREPAGDERGLERLAVVGSGVDDVAELAHPLRAHRLRQRGAEHREKCCGGRAEARLAK
jgi:hypothetical protein